MIKNIVVEVSGRTETGKNVCRRLRQAGKVPGIVYGLDRPPFSVAVPPKRLEEILRLETGRNTIFRLALAGEDKTRAVMIKEIQRDPVSERMLHVDFVRVDLEKTVKVSVPIRHAGTPVGVKNEGGLVEFITRHVDVECLPEDIPDHIEVAIGHLHVGQHISVSQLELGEKVKLMTDPESIVLVIAAPKAEEAPPAEEAAPVAATAAGAEPEVIKKGKEAAPAESEAKDKERDKK